MFPAQGYEWISTVKIRASSPYLRVQVISPLHSSSHPNINIPLSCQSDVLRVLRNESGLLLLAGLHLVFWFHCCHQHWPCPPQTTPPLFFCSFSWLIAGLAPAHSNSFVTVTVEWQPLLKWGGRFPPLGSCVSTLPQEVSLSPKCSGI